jgi:hypothetical protein
MRVIGATSAGGKAVARRKVFGVFMVPWEFLDSASIPGSQGEIRLYKRGEEFSVRLDRLELMNSRRHGSEDALAELACVRQA